MQNFVSFKKKVWFANVYGEEMHPVHFLELEENTEYILISNWL